MDLSINIVLTYRPNLTSYWYGQMTDSCGHWFYKRYLSDYELVKDSVLWIFHSCQHRAAAVTKSKGSLLYLLFHGGQISDVVVFRPTTLCSFVGDYHR